MYRLALCGRWRLQPLDRSSDSDEPVDRLIGELKSLVEVTGQGFERETLQEEIVRLQLYTEDDPVADRPDE